MPLGDFVLNESSARPVVLISGGVGITPVLSMFERLAGSNHHVTFIHGTGNRSQHAFGDHIRAITRKCPNARAVIFYNEVEEDDICGEHYDEIGFIDAEMLNRHVPSLDAEFYFCGSVPFMRAIEAALASLSVPQQRRHSEAFGPDPTFLLRL